MLIQSSCGISRPLGDPKKLRGYLRDKQTSRLRRRLEADARSLVALYEYGRLHGAVRIRSGIFIVMLPVTWVHPDETRLHQLMDQAHEHGVPLEVVVGSAPGWDDPWSGARLVVVAKEIGGWQAWLLDETGTVVEVDDVQRARLAPPLHGRTLH